LKTDSSLKPYVQYVKVSPQCVYCI